MANFYSHCWQQFDRACTSLTGVGDKRERLVKAMLAIYMINPDDFPPTIKPYWLEIRDKHEDHGEIQQYVSGLTDIEITELYGRIRGDFEVIERENRPGA